MGKIITKTINRFDGGRSNDYRSSNSSKYALTKHFDSFTFPHKLVPRQSTEDKETGATDIVKTLYAYNGSTNRLWGLDKSGLSRCVVKYWTGTAWAETANNSSGVGTRNDDVFFLYKDEIYMFGGNNLQKFAVDASAFDDSYQTLNPNSVAQPVHHPADDNAYFFVDNLVYRLDASLGTPWEGVVLTLPDDLKIVKGIVYGDYLAIACVSKDLGLGSGARSIVYIWDRDSSLETLTKIIDYGAGIIRQIDNLDSRLVAVMDSVDDEKMLIKADNGRFAKILNEITIDSQQVHFTTSQKVENKLYFPMEAPRDNDDRLGVWVLDSSGRCELDFTVDSATQFDGIYWTGSIWWFCHSSSKVSRSISGGSNDGTYETLFIGNPLKNHKLLSVGIALDEGGSGNAVMGYRLKTSASFTEIFTFTPTSTDRYHDAVNIESDGSELPEFREIQLQVVSSRPIIGIRYTYEEVDDNLN